MPSMTEPLQRTRRNNRNGVLVHSIWSPDTKVMAVAKIDNGEKMDHGRPATLHGRPAMSMAARSPHMAGRPSHWPPGQYPWSPNHPLGFPTTPYGSQTQRNTKGDESNRTIKYPMKPRVGRPSHKDCNPRKTAWSQSRRNTWPPGH